MARLLRIDSSSRLDGSRTRALADYLQAAWLAKYPDTEVIARDVVETEIPHIAQIAIAGSYTPPDQRSADMTEALALSDILINELMTSETLVFSVPMYNFSVPSALKAWIDQIVQINRTFTFDGTTYEGLVTAKRAFVICSYGAAGYVGDGPFSSLNFLSPYMEGLLGFLGVAQVQCFHLEGTAFDAETIAANVKQVQQEIDEVIAQTS
ncbi:MAG: NAD(P)H-dependent oxidoreductase [Cyanobacteria bacterium P01_F01_bin.153]